MSRGTCPGDLIHLNKFMDPDEQERLAVGLVVSRGRSDRGEIWVMVGRPARVVRMQVWGTTRLNVDER